MTTLTELARGQPCTVRLPGCSGGGADTVAAHFRDLSLGGGMGLKPPDYCIAFCCAPCHEVCDARMQASRRTEVRLAHAIGVMRTWGVLIKLGAITL